MKIYTQIREDDAVLVKVRAEVNDTVGDLVETIKPGEAFYPDEDSDQGAITYDELLALGDGVIDIK